MQHTHHPSSDAGHKTAGMDWRVTLGLSLTVGWLVLGAWYMLFGLREWREFVPHNAADLGSFLQGVFAPLAFLWLVLGHFMQQGEIAANTRAIQMQETNTRRMEMLSRRDSFFNLQNLVQQQLGSVMSMLYLSIEGSAGNGNMSDAEYAAERQRMDQGDYALFVRRMLWLCLAQRNNPAQFHEYFFGTDIRERHTRNFCSTFEKLIRIARDVDEDDMIVDALTQGSAIGRLYQLIQQLIAAGAPGARA